MEASTSKHEGKDEDLGIDLKQLGARFRAARKRSGMKLAEVAQATGLSTGFISLLENGKTNPTVGRMTLVLRVYGMSLTDAFGGNGGEHPAGSTSEVLPLLSEYVSARERLTYRFFNPDGEETVPVHVLIEPGGGWFDESQHDGAETIFVLHGTVELHAGDVLVTLRAGERYRVPALVPHRYRALGAETVELFVLLQDPKILSLAKPAIS